MRRIAAVVLITVLVAPPATAEQKQGKPIDWQKAQKLKPGTEIVLTVTGGQPTKVRLLFADEATLVVLKPTAPELPRGVEKLLVGIGPAWPGIVNTGAAYSDERRRVSQDGIFDRDKKVAGFAEVIQQTPREQVQAISEAPHSHRVLYGSIAAAAGIFAFVLFLLWYGWAD